MIEAVSVSVSLRSRTGCYSLSSHRTTSRLSLQLRLPKSTAGAGAGANTNTAAVNTNTATVIFLDDTRHTFPLQKKAKGGSLLASVCEYLDLTDGDYFGLQFTEDGSPPDPSNVSHTRWLDRHKRIDRQAGINLDFWFAVRFWTDEPSALDPSARSLFCLQIRKLLRDGRLQAPRPTRLLLASYRAQAELGDWTAGGDAAVVIENGIDSPEDVRRVRELHRLHRNQTKAIADLHYLEHARRLDGYGVEAHPAKDSNGKDIAIGITSQGLVVFQNILRVNTFSWAKIVKLSYKRKQFFIQLKREASENYDTVVGFNTCSFRAAKSLFRNCVQQHSFHRLQKLPAAPKYPTPLHRFFIRSPRKRESEEGKANNGGNMHIGRGSLARVQEGQAAPVPRAAWGQTPDVQPSDDEGGFLERALRVPLGYADEDDEDDEEDDLGIIEPTMLSSDTILSHDLPEQDTLGSDTAGLVTVRLSADAAGRYGFNIRGGAEFDAPIVVSRVAATTSPSSAPSPHLQEGDQVLAINGVAVDRLKQEQVIQLIRSARGTLTITLKPNAEYSCCEEEEPIVQYVPESGSGLLNDNGGVSWKQALLLIADGLGGAALQQFERLPKRADHASTAAKLPQNLAKNRYRDIAPYDCNRVVLGNGEYINASYINLDVPNTSIVHSYIATQGPLPNTVADFWQMVLESGSTLIVMLGALTERGRIKCHQYWAAVGKGIRPGGANGPHVQTLAEMPDPSSASIHRHLLLSDPSGRSRAIHHLQYLAWPDHGVPAASDSFLALASRMAALRPTTAPAIVHCSAGVGRTGALLLMDQALALLRHTQPVYPLDLVKNLRDQRPLCVQNANQYKFICECIGSAAENMGLLPSEKIPATSPSN